MIYRFESRGVSWLMGAYLVAATIASVAALLGFFDVGGLGELFTRSQRARGTFKDPNVFGPFLVPAIIYGIYLIERRQWVVLHIALVSLFLAAIFLSFSRGAWFNLGISLGIYFLLQAILYPQPRRLLKQLMVFAGGLIMFAGIVLVALNSQRVAEVFSLRSSLVQEYDIGEGGRFDTQRKSIEYILSHPFGLGPGQSSERLGIEPHNVYLYTFVETGWISGFAFLVLMLWVVVASGRTLAVIPEPSSGGLIVVFACFTGILVESFFIDSLHWRHLFLMMGILLGYIAMTRKLAHPPNILVNATTNSVTYSTR